MLAFALVNSIASSATKRKRLTGIINSRHSCLSFAASRRNLQIQHRNKNKIDLPIANILSCLCACSISINQVHRFLFLNTFQGNIPSHKFILLAPPNRFLSIRFFFFKSSIFEKHGKERFEIIINQKSILYI